MFRLRNASAWRQVLITAIILSIVTATGFFITDFVGYRVIALLLLMTVSLIAMAFDIGAVIFSCVISAFTWNYFFIPPTFTFHISNTQDTLLFLFYFMIAILHGVFAFQLRRAERKVRDKEDKERTIALYNTLLNSLSHELRTPLATIMGSVDTLKTNPHVQQSSAANMLLEEVDIATVRLNHHVQNLLDLSRIESGMIKPNRNWCDISDLISTIKLNFPADLQRRITFTTTENMPLVRIDSGILEQAILNLIQNAFSHNNETCTVTVTMQYEKEQLIIRVSDTGSGIPDNFTPFLFDKFSRAQPQKAGGLGLGMSIAKGFVTAHLGTIQLVANSDMGCCFEVNIPAEASYVNQLSHE